MLSEFLADGPPQIQEDGDQATGDRRPVPMEQDQAGEAPRPGDEEPRETAADAPVLGSGGFSFYDDDVASVVPREATLPRDLVEDLTLPVSTDPVVVEQSDEPVVLSSLAGGGVVGSDMDAPTPALAPPPTDPDPEADPLTERRIAAGEDINGESTSDGNGGGGNGGGGAAGGGVVTGTADDETLQGGTGDDTLTGAGGQDIFEFSVVDGGNDVVTDFEAGGGGDIVRLTDVTDADGNGTVELADLDADAGNSVSSPAGSLVLGFASGASITLSGVDGGGIGSFADLETSNVNVDVA